MAGNDIRKKDGELLKYKNVFSGWGKRYFRLERSYLHYFETKHSHKPLATITRGEIAQIKQSVAFPGRNNVFEIVLKSGVIWFCQAKSPEEMVSWMQAFSTVPFVLNPSEYAMVPDHQAPPFTPQHPPLNSPPLPPCEQQQQPFGAPPGYDSPYRELINDAHHTAYVSNTPHDCVHNSPPPPYSPQPIDNFRHIHPQHPNIHSQPPNNQSIPPHIHPQPPHNPDIGKYD